MSVATKTNETSNRRNAAMEHQVTVVKLSQHCLMRCEEVNKWQQLRDTVQLIV